jgi:hypothetical protein
MVIYLEFTLTTIAYIEFVLFVLFTGIKPVRFILQLVSFLRKLCMFIANSFVVIHPIQIPGFDDFESYDTIQYRNIREEEHVVEFIYSPIEEEEEEEEEYKANEQWHIVADHLGIWHIGLIIEVVDSSNDIVSCIDVLVRSSVFFRFPIQSAKQYLIDYIEDDSVILAEDLAYNIREGGIYDLPDTLMIIKTYWIRIIQRRWKTIYAERKRLLLRRGSVKAQRKFELSGNYGIGNAVGMRGMLFVKSKQI